MNDQYLFVERGALPDYFEKVVKARNLMESGACTQVSEAVRRAGISRSTFYKYKDKVIEPSQMDIGHKASLMLTLVHEAGNLSRVLNVVSAYHGNILTITQSLPVHGKASIMLTLDTRRLTVPVAQLINALTEVEGAEKVRLLALE